MKNNTILVEVSGTVQGVGFRPFVYNLAVKNNVNGFVRNTGAGAEIIASAAAEDINKFVAELERSGFEAAYKVKKMPLRAYRSFKITGSKKSGILSDFPQDLALCGECRKELFSSKDRRYRYPFINCVKCGPRFSIIKKLPYDRKNTTMAKFCMCEDCLKEYNDPLNRRFHAQPNACHKCGPQLSLFSSGKEFLSGKSCALSDAVKLLKKGKILAVKGIGGYHLCCDASNLNAVKKLRKRKQRPYKPFAVMAGIGAASSLCFINKYEKAELLSQNAPIVILVKKRGSEMLDILAPDNSTLGVMAPYAPLHHLLINEIPVLVMTSGNKSDEPICASQEEAFRNLKGIADFFLTHDRDIENRLDDSIVRFLPASKEKIILRRSRGYVPVPVKTEIGADVFAAGGDLKNNFCLVRKGNAYLSQFGGDLEENRNLKFYGESISKMEAFLDISPENAVCDSHPGYHSSDYARSRFKKTESVYHHYAHMASVIAEHNLKGNSLGFIFDGSGFGEDGKIWGGEVLLYCGRRFKRCGHFDYFNLPGGDICTKEIWRVAVSLIHKYGLAGYMPKHLKKYDYKLIMKMADNGINSPLTSSVGRIFDAVASLTGIKNASTFEAEAASALESAAYARKTEKYYDFDIKNGTIILSRLLKELLTDIKNKVSPELVSAKFHNTISEIIVRTAMEKKVRQVILGGGVFQNVYLLNNVRKKLLSSGFDIYYNKQVPLNDGGICLGQAYINKLLLKNK